MTANNDFLEMDNELDEALTRLAAGTPLEVILAEAGDEAGQLGLLLAIAGDVANLKPTIPIPPPEASLQKLLAHGQKLAASSAPPAAAPPPWRAQLRSLFHGGFRLAAGLATALLLFFMMSGILYVAAQRSLPGDMLYPFKQAGEKVQFDLSSAARQEQLRQAFNRRRLAEIEALLQQDKTVQVTFEGQIQAVSATTLELDGLTLQLTPETRIVGQPAVGARVRVQTRTQPPQTLLALTVTILEPGLPPTPSPTPTTSPTATTQPTATLPKAQATDTLSPTATPPKAQATDTINLEPTFTATPRPVAVDDNLNNGDDFTDDNANDNFNQSTDDNFDDNDNQNSDLDDNNETDDNFNDNGDQFDDTGDDFNDNGDEFNDNTSSQDDNNNANEDNNESGDDRSGRGNGGSDDSDNQQDDSDHSDNVNSDSDDSDHHDGESNDNDS